MNEAPQPERLDLHLVRNGWASSRREARELIALGAVKVNGHVHRKGSLVAAHDCVEVLRHLEAPTLALNPDLPLEVLFADAALLVVNKPAPMPCHPLHAGEIGTVMNAVAARFPDAASAGNKPLEGGLVHRLDNGTSGALLIARTPAAFAVLRRRILAGEIERRYQALVAGAITSKLELRAPVGHAKKNPRKMVAGDRDSRATRARPRPAATLVEPLRRVGRFTRVIVIPRTGSRHQIRVHLAACGHPLAGDALYGGPPVKGLMPGRFWLHLGELCLVSPESGAIRVTAPLPPDLSTTLK